MHGCSLTSTMSLKITAMWHSPSPCSILLSCLRPCSPHSSCTTSHEDACTALVAALKDQTCAQAACECITNLAASPAAHNSVSPPTQARASTAMLSDETCPHKEQQQHSLTHMPTCAPPCVTCTSTRFVAVPTRLCLCPFANAPPLGAGDSSTSAMRSAVILGPEPCSPSVLGPRKHCR